MSDPENANVTAAANSGAARAAAAGWYRPTPESSELRWWDGQRWTDNVQAFAAALPSSVRTVPAGTPVYNVFIWLITLLPLVSLAALSQFDMAAYMTETMQYSAIGGGTTPLLSSSYLLLVGSGWLLWGVTVVLAYLDWRRLGRDGFTRRFHWAWSFLNSLVYLIGRTVLVRKQSRRGMAVIWAYVGVLVLQFIVVVITISAAIAALAPIMQQLR